MDAAQSLIFLITSGYAMVVHGCPKPLKIQVFWGHPAPRGHTVPIF